MANETTSEFSEKRGELLLWLGLLLPPIAWAAQLQTLYLSSEYGCATNGDFTANHAASIVALILSVSGGLISRHNWQKTGGKWKSEKAGTISRSRFMSILGMLTGGLFSLVIFAQWLPTILGVPCEK